MPNFSKDMQNNCVIDNLQNEMQKKGYISKTYIRYLSSKLNIPESDIYGIVTFYKQFSLTRKAKYNIEVCEGTACFILGAEKVIDVIKNKLEVNENGISKNGKFHVGIVRCLGCCGDAPVVSINKVLYKKVTLEQINKILDELSEGEK